jgi:hypothetical protein
MVILDDDWIDMMTADLTGVFNQGGKIEARIKENSQIIVF